MQPSPELLVNNPSDCAHDHRKQHQCRQYRNRAGCRSERHYGHDGYREFEFQRFHLQRKYPIAYWQYGKYHSRWNHYFHDYGNPITFAGTGISLGTGAQYGRQFRWRGHHFAPLHAGAGSLRTVALNAGAGAITVVNIGTLGNGELSSAALNGGNILIPTFFPIL